MDCNFAICNGIGYLALKLEKLGKCRKWQFMFCFTGWTDKTNVPLNWNIYYDSSSMLRRILLKETDNDSIIISMNSHKIYPRNFIETLIEKINNSNKIVKHEDVFVLKPSMINENINIDDENITDNEILNFN